MSMLSSMDKPMMLFLKDGSIFKAKGKGYFTTKFFLVSKIDNTKKCITLMLLKPCSSCTDITVLMPTNQYITITIECFCGYQSISNICVRKCNHLPIKIKDCICGPFSILPKNDESIIWQSNLHAEQYGTLNLYIGKGGYVPLSLRFYFNDQRECETHQLFGKKIYNFSIIDCSRIKLFKSSIYSKLKFRVSLKLNCRV